MALVTHTSTSADGAVASDGATAPAQEPVISVSGLTKDYGEVQAVRGIDFEVARGETFGFLGPNGAGKTTTIKILCTLANATSGTARVAGHDARTERDSVRRNIGLVFQDTTLDTYLTAEQNLRFHAELYGVPKAAVVPRMRQVMVICRATRKFGVRNGRPADRDRWRGRRVCRVCCEIALELPSPAGFQPCPGTPPLLWAAEDL